MKWFLSNAIVTCLSYLPEPVQRWVYQRSPWVHECMDFHILPGSCWVGYEIVKEDEIVQRLPPGFDLATIAVEAGSRPQKYLFFNFFQVECDYFKGTRLEVVTVIKEQKTGFRRFMILDYLSDTISSDPCDLFKATNCRSMKTYDGRHFRAGSDYILTGVPLSQMIQLSDTFAIEANENIYYASSSLPNVLFFSKDLVVHACRFQIHFLRNALWPSCRSQDPQIALYFPEKLSFTIIPEEPLPPSVE